MDEASRCDNCALIQSGEIFTIGKPEDIASNFQGELYGLKSDNQYKLLNALKKYEYALSVQPFGEYIHYSDKRIDFKTDNIMEYLKNESINTAELIKIKPTLEDAFIQFAERKQNG